MNKHPYLIPALIQIEDARIYWRVAPDGKIFGVTVTSSLSDPGPEFCSGGAVWTNWADDPWRSLLDLWKEWEGNFASKHAELQALEQLCLIAANESAQLGAITVRAGLTRGGT